jgi:hypothetical protein
VERSVIKRSKFTQRFTQWLASQERDLCVPSSAHRDRRRLRLRSHMIGGSRSTSSKPRPHATVMSSQSCKGVPSRVSPVTHASVSPMAICASRVR